MLPPKISKITCILQKCQEYPCLHLLKKKEKKNYIELTVKRIFTEIIMHLYYKHGSSSICKWLPSSCVCHPILYLQNSFKFQFHCFIFDLIKPISIKSTNVEKKNTWRSNSYLRVHMYQLVNANMKNFCLNTLKDKTCFHQFPDYSSFPLALWLHTSTWG